MKKTSFSENFKKILAERSLSLTTINEATGIPISTLSEWTAGREPKVSEALVTLCEYLEMSLDQLVRANGANGHLKSNGKADTGASVVIQLDGRRYRMKFDRVG